MRSTPSNIRNFSLVFIFIIIGAALTSCSSDYYYIKVDKSALGPDAIEINRDSLIVDGLKICYLAQRYYYKPMHLGGGGLSFHGFYVPPHLINTEYGKYYVSSVENSKITISAEGVKTGVDGINPIKAEFIVTESGTGVSVFN